MIIRSSFKDYYDTAMSFGIDKDTVYSREQSEQPWKKSNLVDIPYSWKFNVKEGQAEVRPVYIGFCGKIYPAIKVVVVPFSYPTPYDVPDRYFYSYEKYLEFLNETNTQMDKGHRFSSGLRIERIAKEFFTQSYYRLEPLFRELHTPVFVITTDVKDRNRIIISNPKLSDYKFMTQKDPATTFQDIFMFLAGVLGNKEVDTVQIDDKHMLKQKGFDQFSFKTMKGDKKPRAKNRGKDE